MNILVLTEYLPYFPCYDGFRLIPYNILKGLSKNHTIHLLSFINNFSEEYYKENLLSKCATVETVVYSHKQNIFTKIKNIFSLFALSKTMSDKIQEILRDKAIDLIYIEGAHIAHYTAKIKNIPKVVSSHDSPAARGYTLFKMENNYFYKVKLFLDWIKTVIYEKDIFSRCDHCVVVSLSDKTVIEKHCSKLPVSVVSNGVDVEYYAYNPNVNDCHNIVFTGNMSYPPNVEAVLYFYRHIFSRIKTKIKDIKFFVVGADPAKQIIDLKVDESVKITGKVDDIREYIYASSVYVCPMVSGTGIKNKILEAMAMGIPIVSTDAGVAGIAVTDSKDICVENTPEGFADRVSRLLINKEERIALSKNARGLVEKHYNWAVKAGIIEGIMIDVVKKFNNLEK